MKLKSGDRVVDLGCGQGVLGRQMSLGVEYVGIDIAGNLIQEAKLLDKNPKHQYRVGDIIEKLEIKDKFDKAVMLLTLQNLKRPFKAVENAKNLLKESGKFFLVINHPCFRIPKNSDWGVDKMKNIQYRRVDRYMLPMEIPIEVSPFDKKTDEKTLSFHHPLSAWSEMLFDNGLMIEKIEEWVSDKKSTGSMAKIEDRARKEFPLFMAIVACRRQDKTRKFPEEQNL